MQQKWFNQIVIPSNITALNHLVYPDKYYGDFARTTGNIWIMDDLMRQGVCKCGTWYDLYAPMINSAFISCTSAIALTV